MTVRWSRGSVRISVQMAMEWTSTKGGTWPRTRREGRSCWTGCRRDGIPKSWWGRPEGEQTAHVGYEKHAPEGRNRGNSRNETGTKRLTTETGELEPEIPRDREGSFDPVLVQMGQRRLPGFDGRSLPHARGMTTQEIEGYLKEPCRGEVSPTLISTLTDAVLADVKAWQARPLEAMYPIVLPGPGGEVSSCFREGHHPLA
jgi:hypothetical protein